MVVEDKCFNNLSSTSQRAYKQGYLSLFSSRWEMFLKKTFSCKFNGLPSYFLTSSAQQKSRADSR